MGFIEYFARRYDNAMKEFQKAGTLKHNPSEVYFPLGITSLEQGNYKEALENLKQHSAQPHTLGHLGNAYARMGLRADALATIPKLKAMVEKTGVGRYEIALVYAGLAQKDEAFTWLERAYEAHDKGLTYLKIDPCVDPLRSDPRFADLLKRVGLPAN
jgi:tetratricopeptide (TPR) repeat protein